MSFIILGPEMRQNLRFLALRTIHIMNKKLKWIETSIVMGKNCEKSISEPQECKA